MIENDLLGDWSPEKDCCWRLTFRQPVWKPKINHLTLAEDGFRTGCRNVGRQQQSYSGLQSPRIIFNRAIMIIMIITVMIMIINDGKDNDNCHISVSVKLD